MANSRRWIVLGQALVAAGLLLPATAPALAQITSLPFDLVDIADDPLARDDCGVDFTYMEWDTTTNIDASGASIADFDNDGKLDIFLPNSKDAPSKLYRNLGGLEFQDVAVAKGVDDPTFASADALFLDYDHDGDLDLWVVGHLGKTTQVLGTTAFRLFRNSGAAGGYAYVNVTSTAGFALAIMSKQTKFGWVSGVCAGDYNHDGWIDLFASFNSSSSSNDQWRLFRNAVNTVAGDPANPAYTPRIFVDATPNSGLEGEFGGNPWQPTFWDVNRDGWTDLHIAQDFTLDLMFINDKDGTFTNVASEVGLNGNPPENRNEMGTAYGDPDNDLDQDMHLTNVNFLDRFYRNDSVKLALSFTDIAMESGLHNSRFGWGTTFLDLDNDGDQDHLNVSGMEHASAEAHYNSAHLNLSPQMLPSNAGVAWADIASLVPEYASLDLPLGDSAHGQASGDLDGDGDMDVVVVRNDGEKAGVFKNTLVSSNRWLQVDLVNSGGSLDTTGSRVYLKRGNQVQLREIFTGSSFLSQESPRLHFGLGPTIGTPATGASGTVGGQPGAATGTAAASGPAGGVKKPVNSDAPDWLVVRWPDGASQYKLNPGRNKVVVVQRSTVDDTGDLDADGHLTPADLTMLQLLVADPTGFATAYPGSPGLITGDVNNDGVLDADDFTAWAALPPH